MIFGEYPCCDGPLMLSMPDVTPAAAPEDCPHCGKEVWHYFSRIQTASYTEADFLEKFIIDTDMMQIKEKQDE